jgi:hypothetical protein
MEVIGVASLLPLSCASNTVCAFEKEVNPNISKHKAVKKDGN